MERAAQEPVLLIVEDLHWVDPSTLEFLSLLVDQGPTARILTLYTFRPQFSPPWPPRAHIAQLTLTRLPRPQVGQMVTAVAGGKALPAEVVQQIVTKSDGVPLFVEEMTKLDVHFISSLPVMQRTVCKVWADTRPVRIAWAES